ncbi:helix-turn-helix domain-containing protein [Sphingomonas ginsenosidivorax]
MRDGDPRMELCRALRIGRLHAGLRLRALAATCGASASQLSRVERGEVLCSSLFVEDSDASGCRRVTFSHPHLAELAKLGFGESVDGLHVRTVFEDRFLEPVGRLNRLEGKNDE